MIREAGGRRTITSVMPPCDTPRPSSRSTVRGGGGRKRLQVVGDFGQRLASGAWDEDPSNSVGDEFAGILTAAPDRAVIIARTDHSFHTEYTAGMTTSVSTELEIIPPTIGAAMRFMTLAPVPSPHRIGSRPAMIAVTVIIFGRTRSTAPSMMAS